TGGTGVETSGDGHVVVAAGTGGVVTGDGHTVVAAGTGGVTTGDGHAVVAAGTGGVITGDGHTVVTGTGAVNVGDANAVVVGATGIDQHVAHIEAGTVTGTAGTADVNKDGQPDGSKGVGVPGESHGTNADHLTIDPVTGEHILSATDHDRDGDPDTPLVVP